MALFRANIHFAHAQLLAQAFHPAQLARLQPSARRLSHAGHRLQPEESAVFSVDFVLYSAVGGKKHANN